MFRPRGTQARPAIGARTLEGCRSIAEKRKQNKGIEKEKKGRKGKAARKLEEGSLGKRERKRIRIKKRIAGGPARRGVARRVASRVLVGRETLENPGYAKHRKMALQARTLGGTRN